MAINLQKLILPELAINTSLGRLLNSWKHHYSNNNMFSLHTVMESIIALLKEYGLAKTVNDKVELLKFDKWVATSSPEDIIHYVYDELVTFDSKTRLERIMEAKKISLSNTIKSGDTELLGFKDKLFNIGNIIS